MRFFVRKLFYSPVDLYETITNKREKYEPPKGEIYIGSGDFIQQGKHQLDLLIRYIALHENDTVLDIGSGIGRTAIPLTKYLSSKGKYEGFDVVEKGVNWCNSKIKKDFPNFNFLYVPLNNDLYNTHKEAASGFKFPYEDRQFDKVFLFSVFTHMQISEIQHYLDEIHRVLKPNGLCLSTFFIYDKTIENNIKGNTNFSFPVKKEGYRLMDESVKSANIAIEETMLEEMVAKSQLQITNYIQGFWKNSIANDQANDFQDTIVLKKNQDL